MKPRSTRAAIGVGCIALLVLALAAYKTIFSAEQRLYRQIEAYFKTAQAGPGDISLLKGLSTNSLPILLDWTQASYRYGDPRPLSARFKATLLQLLGAGGAANTPNTAFNEHLAAVIAFGHLGPKAEPALPHLKELVETGRSPDIAFTSMSLVGDAAVPIALDWCASADPARQAQGAALLAYIGKQPEKAIPALLHLVTNTPPLPQANGGTRNAARVNARIETLRALGEFPSPVTQAVLLKILTGDDPHDAALAAYALHSGTTNALLALVDVWQSSTNQALGEAALQSLGLRDYVQAQPVFRANLPARLEIPYLWKRSHFSSATANLGARWQYRQARNTLVFDAIRTNILLHSAPKLETVQTASF